MLNKFRLFYAYVSDLLADARVQSMARIEHHTQRISCLDHCLFVSYVSFALSRFFGGNERAVTRGTQKFPVAQTDVQRRAAPDR